MSQAIRELRTIINGERTTDGAGVKMTRLIGTQELDMLDPFLLFDAFESDDKDDYVGGFPSHPHRGFETVTYLLDGRMRHKDNAGNEGVIEPGGVQWMTAGKGIVHSEMPEQQDGLLRGFQLWVNLPASAKMSQPAYQEFPPEDVPLERHDDGRTLRVVSGTSDSGTTGPVQNDYVKPKYIDVSLPATRHFAQQVDSTDNAFIYVAEGELAIGEENAESPRIIKKGQIGILSSGDTVSVTALDDSRFLLISAKPIGEPVARGGPFVMNTHEEITQAFADFRNNRF